MFFNDILLQTEIRERLTRSVLNNRVPHAQLFIGAAGSLKLPMAVAFARFISCTSKVLPHGNEKEADACGKCPSCLKYNHLAHPDLHFIFPVSSSEAIPKPLSDLYLPHWRKLWLEKKGMISLYDWYQAMESENKQPIITAEDCNQIIKKLSYKSYESEYKVMIIWMVEKLFHAAAPKLLKILEEPPDKTLFILIAQEQSGILSTILSRSQVIRFPQIPREDITSWLERKGVPSVDAARAAVLSDGNILKALDMANDPEAGLADFENFRKWLRLSFKPQTSMPELISHSEELAAMRRENQKKFLSYGLNILRQSFITGQTQNPPLFHSEEASFIRNLAPFIHSRNIASLETLFNDAIYHIERNANPKVLLLDMSLKLIRLIKDPG